MAMDIILDRKSSIISRMAIVPRSVIATTLAISARCVFSASKAQVQQRLMAARFAAAKMSSGQMSAGTSCYA
jgi:hypothetical protein